MVRFFKCWFSGWGSYGRPPGGGGFLKKKCTGMLKVDFRILTISIPQKAWFRPISIPFFYKNAPNLGQIVCFFGKIFENTPNLANWAHWVCDQNPPINIPKLRKMHPKTFEHPRIPFVSKTPPPLWGRPQLQFQLNQSNWFDFMGELIVQCFYGWTYCTVF